MLNYSTASHGKQLAIGLIDALLSLALGTLLIINMPEVIHNNVKNINGSLLVFLVFVIYRLLSLYFFNGTVGMRLFKVVLLNGQEQPLTFMEKTMAAVFILFR